MNSIGIKYRLIITLVPGFLVSFYLVGWSFASNESTLDDSYVIRSVRVEGGWLKDYKPPFALPINYSPQLVSQAMHQARADFKKKQERFNHLFRGGYAGVLYLTRDLKVENKNIDLVIRLYYFGGRQITPDSSGVLIPELPLYSYLDHIPDGILQLAPQISFSSDRTYGAAPELGLSFDLGRHLARQDASHGYEWLLNLKGRNSLNHDFYGVTGDTNLKHSLGDGFWQSLLLRADVGSAVQPLGDSRLRDNSFRIGGGPHIRPNGGPIDSAIFGGFFRYSDFDFKKTENGIGGDGEGAGVDFYLIADGRIQDTQLRMGLWSENGFPVDEPSYHKIATTMGFNQEISLPRNSNLTVGIELVGSVGYAFSELPDYEGFAGGNRSRTFLQSGLDDFQLDVMPDGPLFRSVGERQLLVRDSGQETPGSSYWQINLDIALPLPFAYFPLIPDEQVDESITLREMLINSLTTAENMTALSLMSRHPDWGEKKARQEARQIVDEVRPTMKYLAYKANVFALKPLIMVDLASVGRKNFSDQDILLGIGGGLQLSIVNARLELGYMHTVIGHPSDQDGNFFTRLVFRTLF